MQAFKDAKRRIYQTGVEKLGKAERLAKDQEEYKLAVDRFKNLEHQYRSLYEHLKLQQQAGAKFAEKTLSASASFASFFESTATNESVQLACNVHATAQRAHDILQPSCSTVVEQHALFALERVLKEQVPQLKKRIIDHKNLETDVSSYARRLKTLLEKRAESDPEVVKQREKYQLADENYTRLHTELLRDLNRLEDTKHEFVKPIFDAFLCANGEMLQMFATEWNSNVQQSGGGEMQREIQNLVASGIVTPNARVSGEERSSASRRSSGFFRKLAGIKNAPSTPQVSIPAPPPIPMATSESFPTSHMPPPPPPPRQSRKSSNDAQPHVRTFSPGCVCVTHTSYVGMDYGDLTLRVGDRVIMREQLNPGWWIGVLEHDGSEGLFPDTYVSVAAEM